MAWPGSLQNQIMILATPSTGVPSGPGKGQGGGAQGLSRPYEAF